MSTKLESLNNSLNRVDALIVGGGITNTFCVSSCNDAGASLSEPDLIEASEEILSKAKKLGCEKHISDDVVVAEKLALRQMTITFDMDAGVFETLYFGAGTKANDEAQVA